MAMERAQRAGIAIVAVVLAARVAVVDEQHRAPAQPAGDGLHPVRQLRQQFRAVPVGQRRAALTLDMTHRRGQQRIGRMHGAAEALAVAGDVLLEHLALADDEARRGQRIDDLVGEQHALPVARHRAVHPLDAREQIGRQALLQMRALAFAQIGTGLEDRVARRRGL